MPRRAALSCLLAAGCLASPPSATSGGDGGLPDPDAGGGEGFAPLCPAALIVSHWRFDGDLAAGVEDSAGDNDGTIAGSAPLPVAGRFGQAGGFRADPAGFVLVPDDDSLDLAVGSLEIWTLFRDTTVAVVAARDAMFNPESDDDGHLRIRYADDAIRVRLQEEDDEVMLVSGPIAVDEWTQIIVNWGVTDVSGRRAELWVDGELEAETTTPFNWAGAMNPLVFGTDQDNAPPGEGTGTPTQYLDGAIDEIVLCSAPATQ